jgi:hypothetical protein
MSRLPSLKERLAGLIHPSRFFVSHALTLKSLCQTSSGRYCHSGRSEESSHFKDLDKTLHYAQGDRIDGFCK